MRRTSMFELIETSRVAKSDFKLNTETCCAGRLQLCPAAGRKEEGIERDSANVGLFTSRIFPGHHGHVVLTAEEASAEAP